MRSNWPIALESILKSEGFYDGKRGWQNDPDDKGGPTLAGITYANYCEYKGLPPPRNKNWNPKIIEALQAMPNEEIVDYYERNKWAVIRADELPPGVDLAVADVCVLHGPGKAKEFLRRAIGMPPKGPIDDAVLDDLETEPSLSDVVNKIADLRRAHYDAIIARNPSQKKWRNGWYNRTKRVQEQCCTLAEAAEANREPQTDLGKADADVPVSIAGDAVVETKPLIKSETAQHGGAASLGGGLVTYTQADAALVQARKADTFLDGIIAFGKALIITETGFNWVFLGGVVSLAYGLGVVVHRYGKNDVDGLFKTPQ